MLTGFSFYGCYHFSAFSSCICSDLAYRVFYSSLDNFYSNLPVAVKVKGIKGRRRTEETYSSSCDHTFLYCCFRCIQGVIDSHLLFLEFGFGCGSNFNYCNAAAQFCHALFKFGLSVVGFSNIDLGFNDPDSFIDVCLITPAFNDNGFVVVNRDFPGISKHVIAEFFKLHALFFAYYLPTGKDSNVLKHLFSLISEPRSFYSANSEGSADDVQNQSSLGVSVDIFSNNQERSPFRSNFLKHRHDLLHAVDFFVRNQDIWVFKLADHLFGVKSHVRGNKPAVELHTFDHIKAGLHGL